MDQIIKIYEELIQYDASLSKDKASVLQLIKKMVAAKPNVEVNTQWKNAFSQRLTEHIANAKPLNSASYS